MHVLVTAEPIDAVEIMRRVRSDADGAVLLFTGVVRDFDEGRAVEGLRYEAYEAMAGEKLTRICEEVRDLFDVSDIALVHRIGELAVGDVAVAIAVAAPHRDAAYKASREVIERLKQEVPIWKRERYVGGEEEWLRGTTPPVPEAD
jgi:molybdopterin synthase catalytic subunit